MYKSKLWYSIKTLGFLDDRDIPRDSRSNFENNDENSVSKMNVLIFVSKIFIPESTFTYFYYYFSWPSIYCVFVDGHFYRN